MPGVNGILVKTVFSVDMDGRANIDDKNLYPLGDVLKIESAKILSSKLYRLPLAFLFDFEKTSMWFY